MNFQLKDNNSQFDAPDVTDRVMADLGFRRVDTSTMRRNRLRQRLMRTAIAAAFIGAIATGVLLEDSARERSNFNMSVSAQKDSAALASANVTHTAGAGSQLLKGLFAPMRNTVQDVLRGESLPALTDVQVELKMQESAYQFGPNLAPAAAASLTSS